MSRPDTGRGYPGRRDRAKRAVLAAASLDGTAWGARILWAEVATYAIIAGTAVALLLYFLLR